MAQTFDAEPAGPPDTRLVRADDPMGELTGADRSGVLPPAPGARSPGKGGLLEAATVAFAQRGYHGVSVRDLAASVGIQGASFYAHFASKEALLYELMRTGHEAHQVHLRDAILSAGSEPVVQLRAAVRANVLFHATYPMLTMVANSELHALAPDHRAVIVDMRRMSGVLFAAVLERGDSIGAFDCGDPWLAMSAIAGMSVRVAWWFRPPSPPTDEPLSSYPAEAATWLPDRDRDAEVIADAYADYALRIVGAVGADR